MEQNEFFKLRQESIDKMREYNSRSIHSNQAQNMPPVPSFVKIPQNQNAANKQPSKAEKQPQSESKTDKGSGALNIPILDGILKDGDSTLIIGLLLILMSENSDKLLLFALIYILF